MGSGSDYAATPAAAAVLPASGGAVLSFPITSLAQSWVTTPAQNRGVVLKQKAAAGYVSATFCSELASGSYWPCYNSAWRPKLTIALHPLLGQRPLPGSLAAGLSRTGVRSRSHRRASWGQGSGGQAGGRHHDTHAACR